MNVAILTDSFPPNIDGVSNCAYAYANELHKNSQSKCIVVTPRKPRIKYDYPFPVYSFRSVGLPYDEYRAGHPFMPRLIKIFKAMEIDILHVHSPFVAMSVARELRFFLNLPIVFTQHTKWDYDIACAAPTKLIQKTISRYAHKNITAADELWSVSRGAGEYLQSRGLKGEFLVMPNGTDFERLDPSLVCTKQIDEKHNLPANVPVLLFVGRMMWYKNIALIIESLAALHKQNFDFRMLFVGDGEEIAEIQDFVKEKGLSEIVSFAGRIDDRALLRAYYTRSDLFVFASVYDNAPLVVREAAACFCPPLAIRGSSTAEILDDGITGYLCDETSESISDTILSAFKDNKKLKQISAAAADQLYLPWQKVIERSLERYAIVKQEYKGKKRTAR